VSGAAAVFVDRDGVINELKLDPDSGTLESPLAVSEVVLTPSAGDALRRLQAAGRILVGVSNQPAAAKGRISIAELLAIQARVVELLGEQGVRFQDFRLCLHHPDASVVELAGRCDCRKPAPGMLLDSARELGIDLARSWMIGDTDGDVLAGRAAGCRTVLVEQRGSAHKRTGDVRPDAVAADLRAAVDVVLQ
jgi:D-glycero-D-manno-heptose 1,7-bisphosphate phosphatase